MRRLFFMALAAVLLLTAACSKKKTENTKNVPEAAPVKVGEDSVDARFLDQDSYTIPYWLKSGAHSAILVRIAGYDGTEPVDDADMSSIEDIATKGAYDELTTAANTGSPDRLYGALNTVYVANRLGIVRELWWVMPIFTSMTQEELDNLKRQLKSQYPSDAGEIDGIKLGKDGASGMLNGVPVRIMGLEQLKAPNEPVLLDVDASFFQALYKNEKDTPSLKFMAGMFKLLSRAGLSARYVSVSAAGGDGMTSFRFRAFAKYLKALLEKPYMIESKPPQLWSDRAEAWRAEQKDMKVAVPIYKNIIKHNPDDAASMYDLADLYFRLGQIEECATELEAAAKLDRGYAAAFAIYRDRLDKAGLTEMAKRFYARRPAG